MRALLAGAIVLALAYRIGAAEIWTSLRDLRGWYLPLALVLLLADTVIRAGNWTVLLRTRVPEIRLRSVLHGYLFGGALGSFIPSTLGSDLARTAIMAPRLPLKAAEVASSIIVLNAVGLWTLCAIALAQSLRFLAVGSTIPALPWSAAVGAIGLVGLGAAFLAAPIARDLPLRGPRLLRVAIRAVSSLAAFAASRRALLLVAAMAGLTFLVQFAFVDLLAQALGLDIGFRLVALLLPIVLLSRLVPLSIGGFGAEQGVFVLVFGMAGVAAADAFALSVAASATRLVFWALWALGYLAGSSVSGLVLPSPQEAAPPVGQDSQ